MFEKYWGHKEKKLNESGLSIKHKKGAHYVRQVQVFEKYWRNKQTESSMNRDFQ